MLRIAEEKDFDLVKDMALKFFQTSPYKDYLFKEEMFDEYIRSFLTPSVTKMIIISEVSTSEVQEPIGFIAFELGDWLFYPAPAAVERALWIEPKYRKGDHAKELLGAFIFWASKIGCPIIQLSSLVDSLEKPLDKFYKKMGFQKVENTYLKQVS